MSEIFITSDTHFSHDKDFLWRPRGFSSVEEMNEAIVERWNNIVGPNDLVYHLGDTILNNNEKGLEYLGRLNGYIFLIFGNHETDTRKNLIFSDERTKYKMLGGHYAYLIKYGKLNVYLSHYPTLTANYDEKHFSQHVINFHGHTHQKNNWINLRNPFTYHVGMDSHNCTPISIEEAIFDVKQRFQEVEQLPKSVKPQDTYPYNNIL